ncbi:hypothetical protein PLICRDRAFT_39397 [Plicaturopsis crispa FD-325 SS-3]|nr:hypothetical protein PLICRDRAFT_39397 [Plicaturopsis crispa FD-325 SS-3]
MACPSPNAVENAFSRLDTSLDDQAGTPMVMLRRVLHIMEAVCRRSTPAFIPLALSPLEKLPRMSSVTPLTLFQTVGALEIGVWLSTFLYGCQTFQTYFYFTRRCYADPLPMRLFIGLLWLFEMAHTISASQSIWSMTTTDFGHPDQLFMTHSLTGLYISVLIADLLGPSVQAFYSWRIQRFSGNIYVTALCLVLLLGRVVAGVSLMIIGFRTQNIEEFEEAAPWLFMVVMILSAVTDIIIAVSMCFYLRQRRQNTFRKTAALLDKLMYWTVQTGLITSVATTFELCFFLAMRSTFVWIAPQLTITKLYSNTLLATLNGRETLKRMNQSSNIAVTVDTVMETSNDRAHAARRGQSLHNPHYAIEFRNEPETIEIGNGKEHGNPDSFELEDVRTDSKTPAV